MEHFINLNLVIQPYIKLYKQEEREKSPLFSLKTFHQVQVMSFLCPLPQLDPLQHTLLPPLYHLHATQFRQFSDCQFCRSQPKNQHPYCCTVTRTQGWVICVSIWLSVWWNASKGRTGVKIKHLQSQCWFRYEGNLKKVDWEKEVAIKERKHFHSFSLEINILQQKKLTPNHCFHFLVP